MKRIEVSNWPVFDLLRFYFARRNSLPYFHFEARKGRMPRFTPKLGRQSLASTERNPCFRVYSSGEIKMATIKTRLLNVSKVEFYSNYD